MGGSLSPVDSNILDRLLAATDVNIAITWSDRSDSSIARISTIVVTAASVPGRTATGTFTYVLDTGKYYNTNFAWVIT